MRTLQSKCLSNEKANARDAYLFGAYCGITALPFSYTEEQVREYCKMYLEEKEIATSNPDIFDFEEGMVDVWDLVREITGLPYSIDVRDTMIHTIGQELKLWHSEYQRSFL